MHAETFALVNAMGQILIKSTLTAHQADAFNEMNREHGYPVRWIPYRLTEQGVTQ